MERIKVTVREVIAETPDAFSLVLENHPGLDGYKAGQFINVHCKVDGEETQRSYSFSTSPLIDPYPVLTIKRVPRGKVSNHLHKTIRGGDTLAISEPLGRFVLDEEALNGQILLIAGGSGITPIFGLLKEGLEQSSETQFTLVYANRNEDIIFQKALDALLQKHQSRLDIHYFLEEGNLVDTPASVHKGRTSLEFLVQLLKELDMPLNDVTAYVCGPEGLMIQCLTWLEKLGLSQGKIRTEYFTSSGSILQDRALEKVTTSEVKLLNLKGKEQRLAVPQNIDILSEFLGQGYKLPHSCREAMCGSCAAKLVEGQVEMKENYALNDAKLGEGYVLLCQSTPVSDRVILEYVR